MENSLQSLFEMKPIFCSQCGEKYQTKRIGEYECPKCGFIFLDDYGKVRAYLEENGPKSAVIISQATGVKIETINNFLRQGRVEIPNDSATFIKCQRCGKTDIRFGKYCPACAAELSKNMHGTINFEDVGDVPTKKSGGMRFLDSKFVDDKTTKSYDKKLK